MFDIKNYNFRELNEKPIMPYHRNSVNSNGYSTGD